MDEATRLRLSMMTNIVGEGDVKVTELKSQRDREEDFQDLYKNVQVCTYLLYIGMGNDDVGKGEEREKNVGSDGSCCEDGQERTRG